MILEIKNKIDANAKKYLQRLIGNGLLIEAEKVRLDVDTLFDSAILTKTNFVLSAIELAEHKVTQKKILSIGSQLIPNKVSACFYGLNISEISMINEIQYNFLFDAECEEVTKVSLFSKRGSQSSSDLYCHEQELGISEIVYDIDTVLLFEFKYRLKLLLAAETCQNQPVVFLLSDKSELSEKLKKYTDKLHEVFTVE